VDEILKSPEGQRTADPPLLPVPGSILTTPMSHFPDSFSKMLLLGFSQETLDECRTSINTVIENADVRIGANLDGLNNAQKLTELDDLITYLRWFLGEIQRMFSFLDKSHMSFMRAAEEMKSLTLTNSEFSDYFRQHHDIRTDFFVYIDKLNSKVNRMMKLTPRSSAKFFNKYQDHASDMRTMIEDLGLACWEFFSTIIAFYEEAQPTN
ncbi:hypothetical protein M8C21_028617, partial [Ambrosia artemisiifolia]